MMTLEDLRQMQLEMVEDESIFEHMKEFLNSFTIVKDRIRLTVPFHMRCSSCSMFYPKGYKLNVRMELNTLSEISTVKFRCKNCPQEIQIRKTRRPLEIKIENGGIRVETSQ